MANRPRLIILLLVLVVAVAYCRGPGAETVVERALDAASENDMEAFARWSDPAKLERSVAREVVARYPGDPPDEEIFARAFRGRVEAWVTAPGALLDRGATSELFPDASFGTPRRVERDRVELPVHLAEAASPVVLLLEVERAHPLTRRRMVGIAVREDGWTVQPFAGTAQGMIDRTASRLSDYERFLR